MSLAAARFALLVVLAASVPPICTEVLGAEKRLSPIQRARAEIERFARVSPVLYRGAQPDSDGLRALRDMGVRTIVNLREGHDERAEVRSLGMRSVNIPLIGGDEAPAPGKKAVRRFFEVLLDPEMQPVFFHCAHGKDRAGTMCALYRMEVDGWSHARAIREMHAMGFEDSHVNLLRFVQTYEPRGFTTLLK